eukprot:602415_1
MATMSQVGMEHLIQFRSLLDSLSHAEYYELVANLMKQNKELFASLLFKHFLHMGLLTSDQSDGKSCSIRALNAKAIEIINARSPKPQPVITEHDSVIPTDISLDHLPDDVIAKISSNLCLNDCIQLEQTNRRIFIMMRSNPLALSSVTLNAKQFKNYSLYVADKASKLSSHRFEAIQNVEIPNMDSNQMINLSRWSHLKSLKLDDVHVYDNLAIDFESLKHLHVDYIMLNFLADSEQQKLYAFLKKCVHLEFLSLEGFTEMFQSELCKLEAIKHIKGLRIFAGEDVVLIDLLQHQLESLHLYGTPSIIHSGKQYAFENLKELCLYIPPEDIQSLSCICNWKCDQLERLHLGIDCGELPDHDQTVMERVLSLQAMNYISLHIGKDVDPENALEQILKVVVKSLSSGNKPRMKIRIGPGLPCNDQNIDQTIMELIETANAHITKDWMFIFDYARMSIKDTKGVQELVQWTRKMNR